jgi:DNA-binding NarL/FixJ family response regulator
MSISISVIEDDETIRKYLSKIIQSAPQFKLEGSAKNGLEARQLISENKTDVYLVDLGLPDVDGIDLIAQIKASCRDAQSLVISTFGDNMHITRSIRAGASGYLLKDEIGLPLLEKILALRNGFSPISQSLVKHLFQNVADSKDEKTSRNAEKKITKFGLTPRELDVLNQLVNGVPIFIIANELTITVHTVNQYLRCIYQKLNVHSRAMAVYVAIQNGFTGA